MAELYRARCQQGHLIVTDTDVRTELPSMPGSQGLSINQKRMLRSAITGVRSKMAIPSLFGMGGGVNITIHGTGADVLNATMLKPKDAKEVLRLLNN